MLELFYREFGSGEPLIILHGLFGSADNWMTQAKMLGEHFHVLTVDQRNHGLSPHSPEHDYDAMSEDLNQLFEKKNFSQVNLIGHSMGGKTAMNFAIKYPEKVKKLVVVDIVPKAYPVHHDKILDGLKALPLALLTSRTHADEELAKHISDHTVRQFLLKNLAREKAGGFSWKMNLLALEQNIEEISNGLVASGMLDNPVLFIMGSRSNYYRPGDEETIAKYFPNYSIKILDAGHWIQAEKPKEFVETALKFLM